MNHERNAVITVCLLLAVLVVGAGAVTVGGASASANGLVAEDVTVSGESGKLSRLTISPELSVEWSGFDKSVAKIRVAVSVQNFSENQGFNQVAVETVEASGASGSKQVSFGTVDLLSALDESKMGDSVADATPATTQITVLTDVGIYGPDGEKLGRVPSDMTDFTVTVNKTGGGDDNGPSSARFSGAHNTDAAAS